MEGEPERRLRERLARLRNLPLLHRRVAAEETRLRSQLDSMNRSDASEDEFRGLSSRAPSGPAVHARLRRAHHRRLGYPHGDRGRSDDGAIVAGIGRLGDRTVERVGHQKGRDLKERIARQYGMPHPEGYAKALRVMELAERFGFPVVSLIDTPGAYPGVVAEQHGQGGAIARSQAKMIALERAVGRLRDRRGRLRRRGRTGRLRPCADAGERDLLGDHAGGLRANPVARPNQAKRAAAAFKPDAFHCLQLGVVDGIVPEPAGGAQNDPDSAAAALKTALTESLGELASLGAELRSARRRKFRAMGVYS